MITQTPQVGDIVRLVDLGIPPQQGELFRIETLDTGFGQGRMTSLKTGLIWHWTKGYDYIVEKPAQEETSSKSLFLFFRGDKPGQCPCGILRSKCEYHR